MKKRRDKEERKTERKAGPKRVRHPRKKLMTLQGIFIGAVFRRMRNRKRKRERKNENEGSEKESDFKKDDVKKAN